MNSSEKSLQAKSYFEQGYNCAQAVLLAFCDETGLSHEQAAKLASTFGGGMGRMREVCGAVSAMFMVEGLLEGYSDPKAKEEKSELYARVRALADRFREKNHSIICRELLIDAEATSGGEPEARTKEYYERRPCGCYVEDAAFLIAETLSGSAN
ncbi:MAG: C-GCAxxG-C-C family protein [Christensenella sp.]|nr:C-GCAxxG-C-C family protein [Christensenella sp.]